MNSSDYVLENYIADLLFPYTNNGAESYHNHLNAEFYIKHPNIYVFVDVLKKIQQTAYVSMNRMSQQARISKYEQRKQRLWCLPTMIKLKFHGTDTDTDTRIGSSCGIRRVRRLPRSACYEPDMHGNPRRLVRRFDRHAHFSSRDSWLLPCVFIHFCRAVSYIT